MPDRSETPLLIGVDGGATEVKAHAIEVTEQGLECGAQRAAFRHQAAGGFTPLPIGEQLAERERGTVRIGALEHAQGESWIEACAQAIESVAASTSRARLLVGMCMPGLKTHDGRGVDVLRNGPRMPDLLDRLEGRIARGGCVLVVPIAGLASDGVACGHGEEASEDGNFRGVANAYYAGGGTGLAECFKLGGRVIALDDLGDSVEKAWAMKSLMQRTYEDHVCVRGINARWVELGGDAATRPETAWPREIAAIQAFSECVTMLDDLLRLRMKALEKAGLPALERIVIGQRLGLLLASPQLDSLRASAVGACPIEMRISTLRAAPAIGAASLAIEGWRTGGHLSAGGALDVG